MSRLGNTRETKRALMRAAKRARAKGVDIIYDSFEERAGGGLATALTGVCAMGADCYFGRGDLALPESEAHDRAYDSIEFGFDKARFRKSEMDRRWWQVRARSQGGAEAEEGAHMTKSQRRREHERQRARRWRARLRGELERDRLSDWEFDRLMEQDPRGGYTHAMGSVPFEVRFSF